LPHWDFRRGIATARVLTKLGCERGADLASLLRETDVTPTLLDDANAEIEAAQEIQLIRNLLQALGNPGDLGLDAGRRYRLNNYGLWGYALLSSPTMGEAVDVGARMLNQTFSLTRNTVQRQGDQIIVTHHDEHLPPDIRHFVADRDRAIVSTLQREVFGKPMPYSNFEMKHAEPDESLVARYTETFGIRPVFSASQHRSHFPTSVLAQPMPPADPQTARQFEELCRGLVDSHVTRTGVAASVRDRLVRTPGQIPDMEQIASEMRMTSRTLRRHLTSEGVTFRALLEEVRSTLAVALMGSARLTHAEIAQRLGYADVTTFIEAFRRWKGVPPSEFRRRQGMRPAAVRVARVSGAPNGATDLPST
jgi:AraC-like DNA-binding protein